MLSIISTQLSPGNAISWVLKVLLCLIWNNSLAYASTDFEGISDKGATYKQEGILTDRDSVHSKISNGLTERRIFIQKKKAAFLFKYGARAQTRFDVSRIREKGAESMDKLYFRRARVKSDGYLFIPKLGYKLEIDVLDGQVLDAVLHWNFYENFVLWGGQTKLRGNRERVISSQNLQMVDRSLLNAKFTLDRDIGFWLMHHIDIGNSVIRESVSVSKGEGLTIFKESLSPKSGLEYTARIEYLPFGLFANKGDYKESDLEREPKPKLSIGVTYDYNNNTLNPKSEENAPKIHADMGGWFADAMFKYRGLSVMAEYVKMNMNDMKCDEAADCEEYARDFYTGTALNLQSGYLFKNNYEIAGRYTQVRPDATTSFTDQTEYTLALSKYIVGHAIKVQTDISLLEEEKMPDTIIYRLQLELSF